MYSAFIHVQQISKYFTLGNKLGEGGFATVYSAVEVATGLRVAIKKMRKVTTDGLDMTDRAIFEAKAMLKLNHECILQCYKTLQDDEYLYFIMELMECSLIDVLRKRGGKLGEREAARVTRDIARGIEYIHRRNLVHFDLKPGNILVNLDKSTGEIVSLKISDFGLCKTKKDKYSTATDLAGTLAFIAPEMLISGGHFDCRVEAWSLGVILHQLLTGKLPFYCRDQKENARRIVKSEIDFSKGIWESLSIEA